MLHTMLSKEHNNARTIEFASISERAFTRTQIEMRDGKIFMRAKKRAYVWT